MRPGWIEATLGELCKTQSGSSNTQDAVTDGKYIFFDRSKKPKRSNRFLFDCEAIIIAGEGAEFRPKKFNGKFDLHQRAYAIHEFGNRIIGDYLFYYLEHVHRYFQRVAVGATVASLRQRHFEELPVIVPPIEEQRRIVAVLDEAFAASATATANAEKNLANARELFEVVLARSMNGATKGWNRKTLSALGKTVTGNTPRTSDISNFGDFIPFIKPGDVNVDGTLNYDNDGLSETGVLSSRLITGGAVLMVCIGATIGKSAFAERDITANQQINALLPINGVSGKFVYFQFLTREFQRSVLQKSGQATLPIISKSKWSDLTIWLPPHDEQIRIVNELDRLVEHRFQLETLALRKVEQLSALKQALLHRAFSGELATRELVAV